MSNSKKSVVFSLGTEVVIKEASKWANLVTSTPNEDSDAVTWERHGQIALWTKNVDGQLCVRTAVPSDGLSQRFDIVMVSPENITSKTVLLYRVKRDYAKHTAHDHAAISHDRDVTIAGYALLGISGKKRSGKVSFYTPIQGTDDENKTVTRLVVSDKPVVTNANCTSVHAGLNMPNEVAGSIKPYYQDFTKFYGEVSTAKRYYSPDSPQRTKATLPTTVPTAQ